MLELLFVAIVVWAGYSLYYLGCILLKLSFLIFEKKDKTEEDWPTFI